MHPDLQPAWPVNARLNGRVEVPFHLLHDEQHSWWPRAPRIPVIDNSTVQTHYVSVLGQRSDSTLCHLILTNSHFNNHMFISD